MEKGVQPEREDVVKPMPPTVNGQAVTWIHSGAYPHEDINMIDDDETDDENEE